jgi:hypothetical protein
MSSCSSNSANSWVATYFAEIEDLAPPETRNFTVEVSDWRKYSGLTVDVAAEAGGKYRLYEPRCINVVAKLAEKFRGQNTRIYCLGGKLLKFSCTRPGGNKFLQ